MTIPNYLQVHRRHKRMSQQELANRLSVNVAVISQIETGKVRPTIDMAKEMATILDVEQKLLFPLGSG